MLARTLLALLLIGISAPVYAAESTMPRELAKAAKDSGCEPIPGFYDHSGILDPPYLYGYAPGEGVVGADLNPYRHVVFWCQRTEDATFQLLFLSKVDHYGRLSLTEEKEKQLACSPVVEWGKSEGVPPGGLSVGYETGETLDKFVYVNDTDQRGPEGHNTTHLPLFVRYGGQVWDLYCHEHQWLIRYRH